MKKIILTVMSALFLGSVIFFCCAGAWVRDRLSPQVTVSFPGFAMHEDMPTYTVPLATVITTEDGGFALWTVARTAEYPEEAYQASLCPVSVIGSEGEAAYVGIADLPTGEAVAETWSKPLTDGARVVLVKGNELKE